MMLSARYSKSKLLFYTACSIAFVGIGFWILGEPNPSGKAQFSAWVGIVFFGPVAAILARRMFHNGEVLRIDGMGVFDIRSMSQPVPWSAVRGITERRVRHNVIFNLHLNRPVGDFVDSTARRAFLSLNRFVGFGRDTFQISANALTVSTDELRSGLAEYRAISTGALLDA